MAIAELATEKANNLDELLSGADLSVIVPCYNEVATIEAILRRVRLSLPLCEIIVVDDGSTDSSLSIVKNVAEELNVLVKHQSNQGKGAAVRLGLEVATRGWVVIQDADLEYDPADLRLLINAARESGTDAVYGSRYKTSGRAKGGAWLNYIGVKILAVLQLLLYGRWLSDPHTCYKMVRTSILQNLNIQSAGFELCAEINSKLIGSGVAITEVPINYAPRDSREGKKIRFIDFFFALSTYLRCRLSSETKDSTVTVVESSPPSLLYIVSRLMIGCLLLVAGVSKILSWQPYLFHSLWIIPAPIAALWGGGEMILGWFTIGFFSYRWIPKCLFVLFMCFVLVLVDEWTSGVVECQCLGGAGMPLLFVLCVDALIVISIALQYRHWIVSIVAPTGLVSDVIKQSCFVVPLVLLASIGLTGSPQSFYQYLSGQLVVADVPYRFAGVVEPSEIATVKYKLKNLSSRPVRIVGAKTSCRCFAIKDLPLTIGPFENKSIDVKLNARATSGIQREFANLLFEDFGPSATLNMTVLVRPNR